MKQELTEFLEGYEKLVIVGIGNDLRGDDALGTFIVRGLNIQDPKIVSMDGGVVPENFTGAIKKETPSHILLVDAVDMKEDPGSVRMVHKEEISNYSISTHSLPISFLIKYLENGTGAKIALIGIQPQSMELGDEMTLEVKKSAMNVLNVFKSIIKP
ncbi:MAG: hydrogenase maturation peptidase HycI [Methanobacteriaceae archaeon]